MNDKPKCGQCTFFIQHYVRWKRKFTKAFCGHCTFTRVKTRDQYTDACDHFQSIEKK